MCLTVPVDSACPFPLVIQGPMWLRKTCFEGTVADSHPRSGMRRPTVRRTKWYIDMIGDDSKNMSELVPGLPVDPDKHLLKWGKYRGDLENLLKCQRDSVLSQLD
ncbi:uncharacterized protein THITE_152972 [Thermothielavioides terrestris NRRL 8126]|uniref:Uncharacterized protein n=1 Tax=Thermothielavioides terrestris (strain ATCC 38088 / NRRL 8126) TaxID=578455 RepID=G2QZW5_THETT|nr:uncharacterized protein THITE_152972 [Thermothielavioides terrestris NRRL 8126]AEO65536.1 hypothetical protein THITE_152972 [Thermothielavioides terrestris NRRL 8126]